MFTGFSDSTVEFFLELRFHNNHAFFAENHDRYVQCVQSPFYELITELSETARKIDPLMETRPYKCLSRIHRDTRFSKDKSPYRDHLWFLFKRAGEPREGSINYYFEFGPDRLGWGMGFWGENKPVMDIFRKQIAADGNRIERLLKSCEFRKNRILMGSSFYKRIELPPDIPADLIPWYTTKEMYLFKENPERKLAFSPELSSVVSNDMMAIAPLYRHLRGIYDDLI